MHAPIPSQPPHIPLGHIKSFGPIGPKYEVGQLIRPLDDGDWLVEVTMIETGKKEAYRWTQMKNDPEAA